MNQFVIKCHFSRIIETKNVGTKLQKKTNKINLDLLLIIKFIRSCETFRSGQSFIMKNLSRMPHHQKVWSSTLYTPISNLASKATKGIGFEGRMVSNI